MAFTPPGPAHQESHASTTLAVTALGMSLKVTNEIHEALESTGFEDILREERNSWWREDLASDCQQFYFLATKSGGANFVLWSGQAKDKDSAEANIRPRLDKMEVEMKAGVTVNFPFRVMLARTSLN
jgi:hypothetical protein